jgi:hypothetical protein
MKFYPEFTTTTAALRDLKAKSFFKKEKQCSTVVVKCWNFRASTGSLLIGTNCAAE